MRCALLLAAGCAATVPANQEGTVHGGRSHAQAGAAFAVVTPTDDTLVLPGPVDSNSPVHWSGDTLYVITSEQQNLRGSGGSVETLRDPELVHYDNEVNGLRWIEATYADGDTLWGWYHNEPFGLCPGTSLTAPHIGAAVSHDDGLTWTDLGIVLEAAADLRCDAQNGYFAGGNGDLDVVRDDDGFFFYYSAYSGAASEQGIALARMAAADLADPVGHVWKWSGSAFDAPGIGGTAQPIFAATTEWASADPSAYWGPSVHWNTEIDQYVMVMNSVGVGGFAQAGIYASFSPHVEGPWSEPVQILASDSWYPEVIGDGPGETDTLAGAAPRLYVLGTSRWRLEVHPAGEPRACMSATEGRAVASGTCVTSASDGNRYQCVDGSWQPAC